MDSKRKPRASNGAAYFGMQTTHTGLVRLAQQRAETPEQAQAALAKVCERYWPAIQRFLQHQRRTRHSHSRDLAEDFAQGFIADLLARGIPTYDRSRSRFRPWLLGAMSNFVGRRRQHDHAILRDERTTESYDSLPSEARAWLEPRHAITPDRLFASSLAASAVDDAWETTRSWYAAKGEAKRFDALERFIPLDELADFAYEQVADALGLEICAVRKAVHDMRERYRTILRERLADTVPSANEVDDELRYLIAAVRVPELKLETV